MNRTASMCLCLFYPPKACGHSAVGSESNGILTAMDCNRRVASFNRDIHTLSSPYCQDVMSLCPHAKGEGDIVFLVWISLASVLYVPVNNLSFKSRRVFLG